MRRGRVFTIMKMRPIFSPGGSNILFRVRGGVMLTMQPQWLLRPPEDLIEPVPALEISTTRIGGIEVYGSMVRVLKYVEEMPLSGGEPQKILKLIERLPLDAALGNFLLYSRLVQFQMEVMPDAPCGTRTRHRILHPVT